MPFWSYGHRLYRSIFYEDQDNVKKELKFGPYRNSKKQLYIKWTQSWPLYRKHIAITSKIFGHQDKFRESYEQFVDEDLEDVTQKDILERNMTLREDQRNSYLENGYWDKKLSGEIYWASIDLAKFYPTVNLKTVRQNIQRYLGDYYSSNFEELLNNLLIFEVDKTGWNNDELDLIQLNQRDSDIFQGIPTGLIVDGFLANIALMHVDDIIKSKLIECKNIAHFRFVDDHVILADDFDRLCTWISEYKHILDTNEIGSEMNSEKTQPPTLAKYLSAVGKAGYDEKLPFFRV